MHGLENACSIARRLVNLVIKRHEPDILYLAKVLTQRVKGQNFIQPIAAGQLMLEKLLN